MQKIKNSIIGFVIAISVLTILPLATTSAIPVTTLRTFAACSNGRILTFPAWYRGIAQDPTTCNVKMTKLNDIWKIVLNLVEILMQAAGYLAAGFMVWGGFKYIKSQGNPQNIASAKSTLMNAAIGLGVALSAVGIVNFVAGRF